MKTAAEKRAIRRAQENWAQVNGHAPESYASRPNSSRPRIECTCGKAMESGTNFTAVLNAFGRHQRDVAIKAGI